MKDELSKQGVIQEVISENRIPEVESSKYNNSDAEGQNKNLMGKLKNLFKF